MTVIKQLRTKPRPALDEDQSIELAEMFRLLGEPSRLRIVLACLRGPMSVGQLQAQLEKPLGLALKFAELGKALGRDQSRLLIGIDLAPGRPIAVISVVELLE